MWIGIMIVGYFLGLFLLIRFLQAVHHWDDEIEAMNIKSLSRLSYPTHQKAGRVVASGHPLKGKRK
jgi:hypothetical protein